MVDDSSRNKVRQVVLDTETTGLDISQGHRIIEIGCVELMHRRVTGRTFHHFLNPERDIDEGALEVHGITRNSLEDQPRFTDIVTGLIQFIEGVELIIHNADFDVGFINAELSLAGHDVIDIRDCCTVIDSLTLARKTHPGRKNSLDALCERYEIDASKRELHGALLDARLLAEVYLAMTGGQTALNLASDYGKQTPQARPLGQDSTPRPALKIIYANAEERREHKAFLDKIHRESDAGCIGVKKEATE